MKWLLSWCSIDCSGGKLVRSTRFSPRRVLSERVDFALQMLMHERQRHRSSCGPLVYLGHPPSLPHACTLPLSITALGFKNVLGLSRCCFESAQLPLLLTVPLFAARCSLARLLCV